MLGQRETYIDMTQTNPSAKSKKNVKPIYRHPACNQAPTNHLQHLKKISLYWMVCLHCVNSRSTGLSPNDLNWASSSVDSDAQAPGKDKCMITQFCLHIPVLSTPSRRPVYLISLPLLLYGYLTGSPKAVCLVS